MSYKSILSGTFSALKRPFQPLCVAVNHQISFHSCPRSALCSQLSLKSWNASWGGSSCSTVWPACCCSSPPACFTWLRWVQSLPPGTSRHRLTNAAVCLCPAVQQRRPAVRAEEHATPGRQVTQYSKLKSGINSVCQLWFFVSFIEMYVSPLLASYEKNSAHCDNTTW